MKNLISRKKLTNTDIEIQVIGISKRILTRKRRIKG